MAPKKSKTTKAEEQAEDAGVELQQAAPKDKSKVPGGKAGGAASGEHLLHVSLLMQHVSTVPGPGKYCTAYVMHLALSICDSNCSLDGSKAINPAGIWLVSLPHCSRILILALLQLISCHRLG